MTLWSTAEDPAVPKLAAATRYLKEQLSAGGGEILPSEECLTDFTLDAIDRAGRTQGPGESYIACIGRHLDERALFIVLWMSTDQACDRAAWGFLVFAANFPGRISRVLWGCLPISQSRSVPCCSHFQVGYGVGKAEGRTCKIGMRCSWAGGGCRAI